MLLSMLLAVRKAHAALHRCSNVTDTCSQEADARDARRFSDACEQEKGLPRVWRAAALAASPRRDALSDAAAVRLAAAH